MHCHAIDDKRMIKNKQYHKLSTFRFDYQGCEIFAKVKCVTRGSPLMKTLTFSMEFKAEIAFLLKLNWLRHE